MTPQEAIQHFTATLSEIADSLNEAAIGMLGEDADWQHHVGSTTLPVEHFGKGHPDFISKVWAARENANSAIAWVQQELEGDEVPPNVVAEQISVLRAVWAESIEEDEL